MDLQADIAKELLVAALTWVVSRVGHRVSKMAQDINAFFAKQRELESRVAKLEEEDE